MDKKILILFLFSILLLVPVSSQSVFALTADVEIPIGSGVMGCEETMECFIPFEIMIIRCDTVRWTNVDTAAHTVSSGVPEMPGTVGDEFDSGLIAPGNTFQHTFEESGTFQYFDVVHPWARGVVIVGPGGTCPLPGTHSHNIQVGKGMLGSSANGQQDGIPILVECPAGKVMTGLQLTEGDNSIGMRALCSELTILDFFASFIGGELLDINTASLLVGALGTNPVIAALVGITIAGVAGQTVWFVHRRRKSENS